MFGDGGWLRIDTAEDVDRLVQNAVPEGPALEYKKDLPLTTDREKLEALKDLTGMGNGGGGTLIIGIGEKPGDPGVPERVDPLTDRSLIGRLEDIVRTCVRPPLVWTLKEIPYGNGFVLVIHVFRSSLGPYMVRCHGEHRYYIRMGSRTDQMDEPQVRDAYALAFRGAAQRGTIWADRRLPIPPPEGQTTLWLTVAGVPLEPLVELLTPAEVVDPTNYRPPHWLQSLARIGFFDNATSNAQLWAQGIFGETGADSLERQVFLLSRDGCIGLACALPELSQPSNVARTVSAQLLYMVWCGNVSV